MVCIYLIYLVRSFFNKLHANPISKKALRVRENRRLLGVHKEYGGGRLEHVHNLLHARGQHLPLREAAAVGGRHLESNTEFAVLSQKHASVGVSLGIRFGF